MEHGQNMALRIRTAKCFSGPLFQMGTYQKKYRESEQALSKLLSKSLAD